MPRVSLWFCVSHAKGSHTCDGACVSFHSGQQGPATLSGPSAPPLLSLHLPRLQQCMSCHGPRAALLSVLTPCWQHHVLYPALLSSGACRDSSRLSSAPLGLPPTPHSEGCPMPWPKSGPGGHTFSFSSARLQSHSRSCWSLPGPGICAPSLPCGCYPGGGGRMMATAASVWSTPLSVQTLGHVCLNTNLILSWSWVLTLAFLDQPHMAGWAQPLRFSTCAPGPAPGITASLPSGPLKPLLEAA